MPKRALVFLNVAAALIVLGWSLYAVISHTGSSFSLYCDLVRRGIVDEKSLTPDARDKQAHDVTLEIARYGGIHSHCAGIAGFAAAVFLLNIALIGRLVRKSSA